MATKAAVDAVDYSGSLVPLSHISDFQTAHTQPETADNSGSTVTDLSSIPSHITEFDVEAVTGCYLALEYDDGLTGITDPVVQPFGGAKHGSDDRWAQLVDDDDNHEITLTTRSGDVDNGDLKMTRPTKYIDLKGCRSLAVFTKTALAGTGTVNNSRVIVKFV